MQYTLVALRLVSLLHIVSKYLVVWYTLLFGILLLTTKN